MERRYQKNTQCTEDLCTEDLGKEDLGTEDLDTEDLGTEDLDITKENTKSQNRDKYLLVFQYSTYSTFLIFTP